MSELYRDFINNNMDDVITALNGTITPDPVNSELYRDFLNRKADDVITALNGTITPAPIGDELYRDFIDRKFDDVIAGIGGYVPPVTFPTLTGSIVTFNSQYAGLPLKSHTIALTATQSGSGTPSPSNPRPITGYSAINISHSDADTSNPTVYTIQIGSTVYGGEYDARTGVLTVTHLLATLTGSESWTAWGNARYTYILPYVTTNSNSDLNAESSMLQPAKVGDLYSGIVTSGVGAKGTAVYISANDYSHVSDFTGMQIKYKLAYPQKIQLPPCPIDTLLGVNNIWADTGDTTLQYIKIGGNT